MMARLDAFERNENNGSRYANPAADALSARRGLRRRLGRPRREDMRVSGS